jgi:hypothetical protein
MANVNLINDIVLPGSMVNFRNNSVITNAIKPRYDDTYQYKGAKAGAAINIRTHQEVEVREDTFNMNVQGVEQKSVPLIRSKVFGVDISYTDAELTQDVNGFLENRVKPIMATLAAKVDQYVYQTVIAGVANAVTLPVTNLDSDDVLNAGVKLDDASCPRDGQRTIVLSPRGMKQLVSSSATLFNNAKNISQQYSDGIITIPSLGFNFGMSQNVYTHTTGGFNTAYEVKTAPVSGATSVAIDTGTGTATVGDVFTFAGIYAVNKLTKQSTGELKQFVVTQAFAGGDATLHFSPPIISSGPYQNVTGLPAVNDDVLFLGAASTAYAQALAFHPDFAAVGFCDLENPEPGSGAKGQRMVEDGVSMSVITGYDIRTRQQYMRWDILMGAAVIEPSMACRLYTP